VVTKPLIIVDQEGAVLDAALMNPKAFSKSTEHRRLWTLHADTGRVLPYRGNLPFIELEETEEMYCSSVERGTWGRGGPADEIIEAQTAEMENADKVSPIPSDGKTPSGHWQSVLQGLVAVISDRKDMLPEGSYTSYLFKSGESKIRKKTGEEAVELVLSSTREETVSEAADLIYHLLVLLEQLEIPFDDVIDELENRG